MLTRGQLVAAARERAPSAKRLRIRTVELLGAMSALMCDAQQVRKLLRAAKRVIASGSLGPCDRKLGVLLPVGQDEDAEMGGIDDLSVDDGSGGEDGDD